MDKSEQYIKMCTKATEIQEAQLGSGWASGEFMFDGDSVLVWCRECSPDITGDKRVWLPRQDQLQEMIPNERGIYNLISEFDDYCHPLIQLGTMPMPRDIKEAGEEERYIHQFSSMEQLWLAFVMQEKYNKVWIGEEWLSKQ